MSERAAFLLELPPDEADQEIRRRAMRRQFKKVKSYLRDLKNAESRSNTKEIVRLLNFVGATYELMESALETLDDRSSEEET